MPASGDSALVTGCLPALSYGSLLSRELIQAIPAHALALVDLNVRGVPAEDACRLVLPEDDAFTVNIYLEGVLLTDIQSSTQFDRDNYSAQFVHFTHNTEIGRASCRERV